MVILKLINTESNKQVEKTFWLEWQELLKEKKPYE